MILLIAAVLDREQIKQLSQTAQNLGLEVLLEVHNLEEMNKALMPSLDMLGVNNRNLKTFEVSLNTSKALAEHIPDEFYQSLRKRDQFNCCHSGPTTLRISWLFDWRKLYENRITRNCCQISSKLSSHETQSLRNAFARQYNGTFTIGPGLYGLYFWGTLQKICHINPPDLPASIKKTGVFVDAALTYILDIAKQHQLQALQLHGDENPDFCQKLQSTGLEVIKAFAIDNAVFDFSVLKPTKPFAIIFIRQQGRIARGQRLRFDWSILRGYP